MRRSIGALTASLTASLTGAALVLSGVTAPAAAAPGDPLTVEVQGSLALPDGDGNHDEAQVRVVASAAGTVDIEVVDPAGTGTPLAGGLTLLDPESDGTFEVASTLRVAGLEAGDHLVRVRHSGEANVAGEAAFTVTTSLNSRLQLTASAPNVFPHTDGYRDTVEFTAAVEGATSDALPVTGTLTVRSGDTVVKTWSISTAAQQSVTWDGRTAGAVVPGEYTVTAAVTTADGVALSEATTVKVVSTRLDSIALTRDGGVAPAKDGYRDTVTLTVSGATSTGTAIPVTGTVAVSLNGRTVKTWPLSTSAPTKLVWDGRTKGRIVAGTYTVTVTASGPEAGPQTSSTTVFVSSKSLVSISGTVRDGNTVTSVLRNPGWGGKPTRVSTQWLLDGTPIPGATNSTIVVTKSMLGHRLSAHVVTRVLNVQRTGTSETYAVWHGRSSETYLRNRLKQLIETLPGDYAVQIFEADRGKRNISINGWVEHEPASSIKIFIAWAVYQQIDDGILEYSTKLPSGLTVEQCLRALIEPSDNYCSIELRLKVGMAYLNRLIDEGGYPSTHFWYANGRTKVTSASDAAKLLTELSLGRLLSADSTERFLHLLKTQVWRQAIPSGLPYNVRQASKPGSLWAAGGMTQTDVAFIWGAKSRYSIGVMGYNGANTASIAKISKLVYSYLQGGFSEGFVYDPQQVQATAKVTLRASPGVTGTITGTYSAGTRIQVIDSIRNWYYVRVAGKTGWMLNDSLALRNPIL